MRGLSKEEIAKLTNQLVKDSHVGIPSFKTKGNLKRLSLSTYDFTF